MPDSSDMTLMGERFGYQPALDGLRAVSIALVLGFHLDWDWLGGLSRKGIRF